MRRCMLSSSLPELLLWLWLQFSQKACKPPGRTKAVLAFVVYGIDQRIARATIIQAHKIEKLRGILGNLHVGMCAAAAVVFLNLPAHKAHPMREVIPSAAKGREVPLPGTRPVHIIQKLANLLWHWVDPH